MWSKSFPNFKQLDKYSCGPTCVRIISNYYGRNIPLSEANELCNKSFDGTSLYDMAIGLKSLDLDFFPAKIHVDELKKHLPCVIQFGEDHFSVVHKVSKSHIHLSDPAQGLVKISQRKFKDRFVKGEDDFGYALLAEYPEKLKPAAKSGPNFKMDDYGVRLFRHEFKNNSRLVSLLFTSLLMTSCFNFLIPYLSQYLFDFGVEFQSVQIVYIIIAIQIMMFLGVLSIDYSRSWIGLHFGHNVNISMINSFISKFFLLPITFYENKSTGDLFERTFDHKKIEEFISTHSISFVFAVLNLVVFSVILFYFNSWLFLIYAIFSSLYFITIKKFLKKKRAILFEQKNVTSRSYNSLIEIVDSIKEIKLNNLDFIYGAKWNQVQLDIFKNNYDLNSNLQSQKVYGGVLAEIKNYILIGFAAILVIKNIISIGVLFAVTFIIGRLNQPFHEIIDFYINLEECRVSLSRVEEVQTYKEEVTITENQVPKLNENGVTPNIYFKDIYFAFSKNDDSYLYNNLSFKIQHKKTTAIVGESGSGKSTLVKMLLKFYSPTSGNICIGDQDINEIGTRTLRDEFSVVLQEGNIFADTILFNITFSEEHNDQKLNYALEVSKCKEFINNLPLGIYTKIGQDGLNLSTGQKQRIQIARAIYKDSDFVVFDEATSSIDGANELSITQGLKGFFANKTVMVIAHRLSTIKNADNIIVLKSGGIIEQGSHDELISKKGYYYNMFESQLSTV